MAHGVNFVGANCIYHAPEGKEDAVSSISAFRNGICVVTCWELTEEEIAEIVRTKRVYCLVMSGKVMFPHYGGTEDVVRELNADYGVWKK